MLWWTLRQLKSKNPETHLRAAKKLGELKDPRAVEALVAVLKHRVLYLKEAAAEALGKIGDQRAVEPLCEALNTINTGMTEAVVEALVEIGDPRAVEPLVTHALGSWNAQISINGLWELLHRSAAIITSRDLYTVANLKTVREFENDFGDYYYRELDCSHVKQLARQELIRRGLEA